MNKEFNIQLLVSYITGNCSTEEQKMVEEWLNISSENLKLLNEYKHVWENTTLNNNECDLDIDKSWNHFKSLANFEEEQKVKVSNRFSTKKIVNYALQFAAVIIVSLGTYFLLIKEDPINTINYSSLVDTQSSPIILPDGSEVTVKNGVEMEYPESFSSDVRELSFKGEAFFEVVSNPDKPMVIALDNIRVKVLGTSFNLSNFLDSDEITIYLESGKVQFYSVDVNDNILEQIDLIPGQKGVYNKNTGLISMYEVADDNHIAWKTGVLEFVKAPLADVITVIEKTYDVEVNYGAELNDYMLTARFNNETPESILESLQVIYGFNYKIEGKLISIY